MHQHRFTFEARRWLLRNAQWCISEKEKRKEIRNQTCKSRVSRRVDSWQKFKMFTEREHEAWPEMSNSIRSIDQYLLKVASRISMSSFHRNVKISGECVGYAADVFSDITINCKLYYFWWQLLTLDSYGLWRSAQATRVALFIASICAAAIKVATNTFSSQLTAIFCRLSSNC